MRHAMTPSLHAQLRHTQPNPGWPHWGRSDTDHSHAIFAVTAYLCFLGLGQHVGAFVRWLGHYDGFECWVEDEAHDPVISVRDTLAVYAAGSGTLLSASSDAQAVLRDVVQRICRLPFMRYRAFWGRSVVRDATSRLWNPLEQSWLSFIEEHRAGEKLWVWEGEKPLAPAATLLRVLAPAQSGHSSL